MDLAAILAAIETMGIVDLATVHKRVRELIPMRAAEAEAQRQLECLHLRAKTSEYVAGMVTWHCPDCHLVRRESHHRERGAR